MTSSRLPLLVGLMGRKRSGKDTFARVLLDEHGFQRVSYADPLREAALRLDPIVGRPGYRGHLAPTRDVRLSEVVGELGWELAKDLVPEVRAVLQRLGTDVVRTMAPDLWVDQAMQRVDALREPIAYAWGGRVIAGEYPVVLTDVRFPNEADAIRDRGGLLLRVVRPRHVVDLDAHPSETALDDYPEDAVIANEGTVEELEGVARYFVQTTLAALSD